MPNPTHANHPTDKPIRVLIYGGGAVGLGIASCLLQSGNDVDILARPQTVAALEHEGLIRTGIFGCVHAKPGAFRCYQSLDEACNRLYDFILICTKSFDSPCAARDLAEHSHCIDHATIVLFQNGWGNAEVFAACFDKRRIYKHRANEVEITVHADSIHIGSLFGESADAVERLCHAISAGGIPCAKTDAIEKDLWAKMLYNCALNPLGAVLGVPYGELAKHAPTRDLMGRIVKEVFAVMAASGYSTHWQNACDFLRVFYDRLVPDTAEHKSSMLQDITAGKRTEIDALNGAVIHLAGECGIDTPYNRAVYHLIKFLEGAGAG